MLKNIRPQRVVLVVVAAVAIVLALLPMIRADSAGGIKWAGDWGYGYGYVYPTPTVQPQYYVGGGGGAPSAPDLDTNLGGEEGSYDMSWHGTLRDDINVTFPDGDVNIYIPDGTQLLDEDGAPLASMDVTPVDPPPAPEGSHVIAAFDFEPDGATIGPPGMQITITYDPESLPAGVDETNLVIAYYDEAAGEWKFISGTVDPATNTVTFNVEHFTVYAIIGGESADFEFSGLDIYPQIADVGQKVDISLDATNVGGLGGSYTLSLKVDGVTEETRDVTLGAGESKVVMFDVARDDGGTYDVAVGGLSGQFEVDAPFSQALLGGIIGGILGFLALAVIFYLVVFHKRESVVRVGD